MRNYKVKSCGLFEIGDFEYEVPVAHFSPPTPNTYWIQGDTGEVVAGDHVFVLKDGQRNGITIPYDAFRTLYAESMKVTDERADEAIHEVLFEVAYDEVCNDNEPDYDEDPPDYDPSDDWLNARYEDSEP